MDRVATTTPRRELEGIEHRIRHLERAIRDRPGGTRETLNTAELVRLQDLRAGWAGEQEANRQLWIRHHEHLFRQHRRLAAEHHRQMIQLLREEVVTGDTPSTNGKH